jgi:hypothetical protein
VSAEQYIHRAQVHERGLEQGEPAPLKWWQAAANELRAHPEICHPPFCSTKKVWLPQQWCQSGDPLSPESWVQASIRSINFAGVPYQKRFGEAATTAGTQQQQQQQHKHLD